MNDERIYIARKIDGTWVAPTPVETEEEARALIAAREPDPTKHSAYHILCETLPRLLADEIPGIKRGIRHKLVKWDGDPPIPDDAADHPEKYPQVAEVMEGGDGISTRVLYRRR